MTIETLAKQGRTKEPNTLAGIDTKLLKQMRNEGLRSCFQHFDEQSHRMEYVASIHGKTFIDDGASHNVNATWYTMEKLHGRVLWIAKSGNDEADYSRLRAAALQKVRSLYCIGENNEALKKYLGDVIPNIETVADMHEAVNKAFYNPIENATIVFSPSSPIDMASEEMNFRNEVNEL